MFINSQIPLKEWCGFAIKAPPISNFTTASRGMGAKFGCNMVLKVALALKAQLQPKREVLDPL